MPESTREKVMDVLQRVLGPDTDLDDTHLELESLKMLEVVVALETEFCVSIPEDAPLGKITSSVNEIVRFLEKIKR